MLHLALLLEVIYGILGVMEKPKRVHALSLPPFLCVYINILECCYRWLLNVLILV